MEKTHIQVIFAIEGKRLVPEIVTKRLTITPTRAYLKGDKVLIHKAPARFNRWYLDTEDEESLDIDLQIKKIYDALKDKVSILNELKKEFELSYQIEVVVTIENGEKPDMRFHNWFIDFIHSIGAEIDIDLYCFS